MENIEEFKYKKTLISNILSYFTKMLSCFLLFGLFQSAENVQAKQIENTPQYKIEKSSCFEPFKCSYDVRIQTKLSEDELLTIAYEIFDDVPAVNKVFIMFYLPCMKIGHGAWASAIFDPTAKINIMDFMTQSNKVCLK